MNYENLLFDVEDGVARVTLAREQAGNAIDLALARELADVALRCDEDPAIRAVLLGAKGKLFCAGGDVRAFGAAGDAVPRLLKRLTADLHLALARLVRADAPVVAAVGGTAAGAGMSLACAADLVVCGESARFTMAYTRVGLTPDGSSTWTLPRLVGVHRALDLVLTNRVLSAAEALDWGIASRVVPDDRLDEEAGGLARELAAGPTRAFGAARRLLLSSAREGFESQMELEAREIAAAAGREDGREGIAAFVEKRAPKFGGR